jgi:hypothetical protein
VKVSLKSIGLIAVLIVSMISFCVAAEKNSFDLSLRHEAENSIGRALAYLAAAQSENGSFNDYPGITGLALTAFARAPEKLRSKYDDGMLAGYKYLLSNQL